MMLQAGTPLPDHSQTLRASGRNVKCL